MDNQNNFIKIEFDPNEIPLIGLLIKITQKKSYLYYG